MTAIFHVANPRGNTAHSVVIDIQGKIEITSRPHKRTTALMSRLYKLDIRADIDSDPARMHTRRALELVIWQQRGSKGDYMRSPWWLLHCYP